jgi:SulP family sulfate permease
MIAYAGLAGLPAQAGLYTLLVTLVAYAVLGTSRHVVVAGTSGAAVLLASGVGARGPSGPHEYAALAAGMVLLAGAMLLLAGLLRLGFIAQFLSRPIMAGFVFGLALFVTVSQLPKLLGVEKGDGDTVSQFVSLLGHVGDANGATVVVGVGAMVLLFTADRLPGRLPGGLIALVLGIGISGALGLSGHGVAVVGEVPSGLPSAQVPDLAASDVARLAAVAAGMVLVIFGESLGAADTFATKYSYKIDANQEMVALGVANLGSGLVGGLAAGGSLSQSAVNEGAGARSEASPLVAAVLAVITVVALTPLFKNLPEAVLAALIIHAVSHLWRIGAFRHYWVERKMEFWLAVATLAGVLVFDVLPGLLIGVVSMLGLFIYNASRPHLAVLGGVPGLAGAYGDLQYHHDYESTGGLMLLRLEAPLFYANANLVRDRIKRLVGGAAVTPSAVVLDVGANGDLDITSAEMLTHLVGTLRGVGVDLALVEVHTSVLKRARAAGVLDALGEDRVFRTLDEAVLVLAPPRVTPMR